jgi:hypothetical protein
MAMPCSARTGNAKQISAAKAGMIHSNFLNMNETPPQTRVIMTTKNAPIALAGLSGVRHGSSGVFNGEFVTIPHDYFIISAILICLREKKQLKKWYTVYFFDTTFCRNF